MKRVYITTAVTCLMLLLIFGVYYAAWEKAPDIDVLKVGFIYENDDSSPYTYNFLMAQNALEKRLGARVQILTRTNVLENETEEPLRELARQGCGLVFAITRSEQVAEVAASCPDTQFCQISRRSASAAELPANYHTFGAELYGARYVSGVAAGMKLREMIDNKEIAPSEALLGFVGAFEEPEVVSGYSAFLIGARSVAPEARMLVKYAGAWCNYSREKAAAEALLEAGCLVIAQHTHSIGPAVACEAAAASRKALLIGSNQNMIDIAPASTLVSFRTNWTPYVVGAAQAVLDGRPIEREVPGRANGNDLTAGFDQGWTQMLELNAMVAAEGTQERMDRLVEQLRRGRLSVFKGDYVGVSNADPKDTIDLTEGYAENEKSSYPTFNYLLKDYITILSADGVR